MYSTTQLSTAHHITPRHNARQRRTIPYLCLPICQSCIWFALPTGSSTTGCTSHGPVYMLIASSCNSIMKLFCNWSLAIPPQLCNKCEVSWTLRSIYATANSLQLQQHTSVCMKGCSEVVCMGADALRSSLQEAKAEAQRVRDCQAELTRQHQVMVHPCLCEQGA